MALGYVAALRNAQLDQITSQVGSNALLKIYSGSRPATGGAETTILASLTCNATFAPAASGGVLTLNAITADSSADNTGSASWFRIATSGNAARIDGSVTATGGGGDLQLNSISITAGGSVAVTSFTITAGNP